MRSGFNVVSVCSVGAECGGGQGLVWCGVGRKESACGVGVGVQC